LGNISFLGVTGCVRRVAAGACALVFGIILIMPETANALDRLRWRVPIAFPSSLPALGDNMPWVAEQLEKASNRNIRIRVVEPNDMVPALELSEAVGQQQVDAGYNWLGYDQGRIPASPLFSAVPFGMEPWAFNAWWYYAGGRELGEEIYHAINVHPILCGITGPETAGWFKEPIEGVDDLRGLKIRFAGLGGQVLESVGASVSLIPGSEIYQSLERGVIDASEFAMPAVDQRLGFDQVAKYNYFPGWHQPFSAYHLIINLDVWNGLSDDTQALIEMACTAGVTNNLAKAEAIQGEVIRRFEERGVTATRLPRPVLKELEAAALKVFEQRAAEDENFRKVYESQQAFREDYKIWKRLAFLPRDF